MDLKLYFERINYGGTPRPDLETLTELHRKHLLAIPYENLDIHLGRSIRLDYSAFYRKLVLEKRGGWCYEMNGLFAMALRELGFRVQLLAGSVRPESKDEIAGNHLVLLVELDRPYLADVGFGDGFLEPLPLAEGEYRQGHYTFRLAREGDYWVMHNHPHGGASRYDFRLIPYELEQFAERCLELQTSPTSGFVRTAVCQRLTQDSILVLRGTTFKRIGREVQEERVVETEAEYRQVLSDEFGLEPENISGLWAKVRASHLEGLARQNVRQW
jgi:N-hydroxyarylamine O-acetyltransferase